MTKPGFITLFASLLLGLTSGVAIAQPAATQPIVVVSSALDNENYQLGLQAYQQKDYQQALGLFQQAAIDGNTYAMISLGSLYSQGLGVSQNYLIALIWYQNAADLGDPDAMNDVGVAYENGLGVKHDYKTAFSWYQKAAVAGNPTAMNNLANLYANGLGTTQDFSQATTWWKKAAAAGDVDAKYYTDVVNESLNAPLHNATENAASAKDVQVFNVCAKAAADGNVDAMNTLGVLYVSGRGVSQDYQKAFGWWYKAAMANDADAMFNVGMLYEHGLGVPQDRFKAHIWIEEAAQFGNQQAKDYLKAAAQQ